MPKRTSHVRRNTHRDPRAETAFRELVSTAKRLQAPGGCPWDRAQTVRSLFPHLVEETWEAFAAHRGRNRESLRDELGDVLYTVLFLALLAERDGQFRLVDMLRAVREKMVRRHPHVFSASSAGTPQEAYQQWQQIKNRERSSGDPRVRSKQLRPLLVASWELLLVDPDAAGVLERLVKALREKPSANGRSKRPNGSRARAQVRSRVRARDPESVG